MIKRLLALLLAAAILIGCSPRAAPIEPDGTAHASSPTPKPSTTFMPGTPVATNCVSPQPVSPSVKIEGTAVFLDHWGQSIVLSGENQHQIPQVFDGNNGNSDQIVSPDRKLLAYRQIGSAPGLSSRIVVITADGHVVHEYPDSNPKWLPGMYWLSNEYIRYPTRDSQDNGQLRLHALSVLTGETRELRTDFPSIADNGSLKWDIDQWSISDGVKKGVNIAYDPSLTRAAYPISRFTYPYYPISLYDVSNDRQLAAIDLNGSDMPEWSPDGKYFSIVGVDPATQARDIYLVSRDGGQFKPVTGLAKLYPNLTFGSYAWSPDSKRIAIWADLGSDQSNAEPYSLILLDPTTGQTTDLCIRGFGAEASLQGAAQVNFVLRGKPVWSPDGRQILITQYDAAVQKVVDVIVDLDRKTAYQIATDLEPIGWMK